MKNDKIKADGIEQSAVIKKKKYQRPRILSTEKLEAIAATCDGSKSVFDGVSQCGTVSPLNS